MTVVASCSVSKLYEDNCDNRPYLNKLLLLVSSLRASLSAIFHLHLLPAVVQSSFSVCLEDLEVAL